ncbi:hypothetical protein JAO29_03065 [Edaphobacter sp. HDX4]|uniref:hypothetical protein n=1 Tax=Edaphobacter sp. HDX4 TaxID=2794064 RepID=UPI002FE63BDB
MKKSTVVSLMLSPVASMLIGPAAWPQNLMIPPPLQGKIQAIQAASRENEQRLHTYQWIETTTVTINGHSKPPMQSICRYAPDGTILKTSLGAQQQPPMPSGGPLMRHVEKMKIEEVQESLSQIRGLMGRYLPPAPGTLQQAFQTRPVGFEHNGAMENSVVIHDYVKQGDSLSLELGPPMMGLRGIRVNTYLESVSDPVTAIVQFATLPDGTHYPGVTTINAPAKGIFISTEQSNFSKAIQ